MSFLWLEYFAEHLNTRLMPEVAINYRLAPNKRTPGSSFKFVIGYNNGLKLVKTMSEIFQKSLLSEVAMCNIYIEDESPKNV